MNFFTLFLLTRSILFHEYVNYIYIYIINDDFMWIGKRRTKFIRILPDLIIYLSACLIVHC